MLVQHSHLQHLFNAEDVSVVIATSVMIVKVDEHTFSNVYKSTELLVGLYIFMLYCYV